METTDARGLSCPEPVLRARRAMQRLAPGDEVAVLVDNATSRENVLRAARSLACDARVEPLEGGFRLIARRR